MYMIEIPVLLMILIAYGLHVMVSLFFNKYFQLFTCSCLLSFVTYYAMSVALAYIITYEIVTWLLSDWVIAVVLPVHTHFILYNTFILILSFIVDHYVMRFNWMLFGGCDPFCNLQTIKNKGESNKHKYVSNHHGHHNNKYKYDCGKDKCEKNKCDIKKCDTNKCDIKKCESKKCEKPKCEKPKSDSSSSSSESEKCKKKKEKSKKNKC